MLKVRIIPCLDVHDGRVVKGVQFVDLRDAGDPVEQARGRERAVIAQARPPWRGKFMAQRGRFAGP